MRSPQWSMSAVGNTLYVAAIDEGLLIFDVTDPANPKSIGSYGRTVSDVLVHDDVAYVRVMYGGDGEIVDVSDPARPVLLTRIDSINSAAAVGNNLWVGMAGRGVVHMDISDPASPSEIGVISGTAAVVTLELRDPGIVSDPAFLASGQVSVGSGRVGVAAGRYYVNPISTLSDGKELEVPFGLPGHRSMLSG